MSRTACAFTGRRPYKLPWKYNEADSRCMAIKNLLKERINGVRRNGTGATVNYARKLGREIIIIDTATLRVPHENPPFGSETI